MQLVPSNLCRDLQIAMMNFNLNLLDTYYVAITAKHYTFITLTLESVLLQLLYILDKIK